MDTATLKQIMLQELYKYTGEGLNATSYLTENAAENLYTVVDIAQVRGKRMVGTVLVVRLAGDTIIIELDHNNKPLMDALIARGIPEAQLIPAYQDTTSPA